MFDLLLIVALVSACAGLVLGFMFGIYWEVSENSKERNK